MARVTAKMASMWSSTSDSLRASAARCSNFPKRSLCSENFRYKGSSGEVREKPAATLKESGRNSISSESSITQGAMTSFSSSKKTVDRPLQAQRIAWINLRKSSTNDADRQFRETHRQKSFLHILSHPDLASSNSSSTFFNKGSIIISNISNANPISSPEGTVDAMEWNYGQAHSIGTPYRANRPSRPWLRIVFPNSPNSRDQRLKSVLDDQSIRTLNVKYLDLPIPRC